MRTKHLSPTQIQKLTEAREHYATARKELEVADALVKSVLETKYEAVERSYGGRTHVKIRSLVYGIQ